MTRTDPCAGEDGRHYEVVSEPYTTGGYGGYEPPETGCDWAMVVARSAKDAVAAAAKLPEFKHYVAMNRGDSLPPWKGIKARRPVCDHGTCWACRDCDACLSQCAVDDQLAAQT